MGNSMKALSGLDILSLLWWQFQWAYFSNYVLWIHIHFITCQLYLINLGFCSPKVENAARYNNMNESHSYCPKFKQTNAKVYKPCDSLFMEFWRRQQWTEFRLSFLRVTEDTDCLWPQGMHLKAEDAEMFVVSLVWMVTRLCTNVIIHRSIVIIKDFSEHNHI